MWLKDTLRVHTKYTYVKLSDGKKRENGFEFCKQKHNTENREISVQMNSDEPPNRRRIQLKYFVTYLCSPMLDKNRKASEVIGLADS